MGACIRGGRTVQYFDSSLEQAKTGCAIWLLIFSKLYLQTNWDIKRDAILRILRILIMWKCKHCLSNALPYTNAGNWQQCVSYYFVNKGETLMGTTSKCRRPLISQKRKRNWKSEQSQYLGFSRKWETNKKIAKPSNSWKTKHITVEDESQMECCFKAKNRY